MRHQPVLLKEVIKLLNPRPGQVFIDCTLGEGGHAEAILKKLKGKGKLLGIDWDENNLKFSQQRLGRYKDNLILVNDNFIHLREISAQNGIKKADGILIDLGFSSAQLTQRSLGISFQEEQPLDMRLDTSLRDLSKELEITKGTAAWIVNYKSREELAKIFRDYGQERFAWRIAKAIDQERSKNKIKTTVQLVQVIQKAIPTRFRSSARIHPATRVFQALRIAVNFELDNLEKVLPQAIDLLAKGGRLAVISFHSLEDKIVKHFFKNQSQQGIIEILTKKPLRPTLEEIRINPRARSAKLRVVEKVIKNKII